MTFKHLWNLSEVTIYVMLMYYIPGVRADRGGADPFLTGRGKVLSLSLRESGVRVPPENEDRPVLRPMGTLRTLRSRTLFYQ